MGKRVPESSETRRCAIPTICAHSSVLPFSNYLRATKRRCTPLILVIYLIKIFLAEFISVKKKKHRENIFGPKYQDEQEASKMCASQTKIPYSMFYNVIIYFMCTVCNWVCTHYYVNYVAFDVHGRFIRSACGDCAYCCCGFFTFHRCNTMHKIPMPLFSL